MTHYVENSSSWTRWTTPAKWLDRVRRIGPILLDPCADANGLVKAGIEWRGPDFGCRDGLTQDWHGEQLLVYRHVGLTFINPPYGRALNAWTAKVAAEAACQRPGCLCEFILLVPPRTETQWGQRILGAAMAVCFPAGHISFENPPRARNGKPPLAGAPTMPNAFFYFGRRPEVFEQAFDSAGQLYRPAGRRAV